MRRVPIEFKPYTYKSPLSDEVIHGGYLCKLYLLVVYDENELCSFKIHPFTSESDLMDNFEFCLDAGYSCRVTTISFPVTPFTMPDMHKRILEYVSCSDND